MKMRLLTGWQARFHVVWLLMLLSALAAGAWPGNAHAQAQVSPLPSEAWPLNRCRTLQLQPLRRPWPKRPPPMIMATWPGCSPPPCWCC